MAKQRKLGPKRRKKTAGVSILSPQSKSRIPWRIAYIDPDAPERGRQRRPIPLEWRNTAELRQEYAGREADRIEERKRELARGATPMTGTVIAEARQQWLETTLHEGTRKMHRNGTAAFEAWTAEQGTPTFDDLRRGHLGAFHDYLPTVAETVSTRNRWQINTGAFLKWAIAREKVPFVAHDDVKRAFVHWPVPEGEIAPLTPAEIIRTLEAADRHDLDLLVPRTGPGRKRKQVPVLPLVIVTTLGGGRRKESVEFRREDFDPTVCGVDGVEVGAVKVRKEVGKGGKARTITLDYTPFLAGYLRRLQLATEPGERLCGITYSQAGVALERLKGEFGAPKSLTWQKLRQTASCYLTSAPGLFGSAAHIQSARRLGHTLKVADKFYLAALAGLSKDAVTLEDSMGITDTLTRVCAAASPGRASASRNAASK
jgi:hypothetical protein